LLQKKTAETTSTQARSTEEALSGKSSSQPSTAEPTTAEPTTAEPTTAEPTTAEPTTAEPTAEPARVSYAIESPIAPEGIATLQDGDFVLSSIAGLGLSRVRVVDGIPTVSTFSKPPRMNATLGVHVDSTSGLVFAVNTMPFPAAFSQPPGTNGVWVLEANGTLKCYADMGAEWTGLLNDLTSVGDDIYVTDSVSQKIFKTTTSCSAFEEVTTITGLGGFIGMADPLHQIVTGIDVIPGTTKFLVAICGSRSGRGAIYSVDLAANTTAPVQIPYNMTCLNGLTVASESQAYAQNAGGVLSVTTTDSWMTAVASESQDTECQAPTTITLKDNVPYVSCIQSYYTSGFVPAGPYFIERLVF